MKIWIKNIKLLAVVVVILILANYFKEISGNFLALINISCASAIILILGMTTFFSVKKKKEEEQKYKNFTKQNTP